MPITTNIFDNKESLLEHAQKSSDKAPETYQDSIYLYFIVRYFVSVYEANFGAIPIQVWNEYRNALDHFFRDITNPESTHLMKMQGHLQRAVLDILKIYCHSVQIKVKELKGEFDIDILKLVDNGNFLKNLNKDIKKSEEIFINAKLEDSSLGDDSHTNKEIVGTYLDAAFSFDKVYQNIIEKSEDIDYAISNHTAIHNNAAKGTFKHHMTTHYIFYISWSGITFLLQFVYNIFASDISIFFKGLFN